jgi:flagellar FliL protein
MVNLASESGTQRYIKVTVAIELDKPEMQKEVEEKKPMIRDIILGIVSSKTADEVITPKGKDNLKNEIVEKLNEKMQDGEIKNSYFTEFMVQ